MSGLVDKVNDEEGYGRVKELKESDFDLSKFTVVGSPLISEDGIANGFSASDYITLPISLSEANSWQIILKNNSLYSNGYLLGGNILNTIAYIKGAFYISSNGTSWDVASNVGTVTDIPANSLIQLEFTGSKYISKYSTDNGLNWNITGELNSNVKITDKLDTLYVGVIVEGEHANCSIDLKSFSITVDGKEVFSGNPTALDTIKANNYTVTGSPTITDDGMFKANVAGDYIQKTGFTNEIKKELRCDGRFYYSTKTSNTGNVINLANGSLISWNINSNGLITLSDGTNTSTVQIEIPLKDGDIFDTEIIYNASTVTLNVCLNEGVNYTTSIASQGLTTFNIWNLSTSENYWGGTIDLNTIHVYIDGNLVYQPCLKIPYTKAKTGSKIVDIAYRLRVEDCYNQYGAGNYYLFSSATEQFALPMPDIYGLIEYLDSKIVTLDNKKVNRAGDIMTGALTIRGPEHPQLSIYRTNPANDTPSEEKAAQLLFLGSDDKWIGAVQNVNYAGSATVDGVTTNYPVNVTGLESRTLQNNGTSYLQEGLWVATDSQGNAWTYAPHPANKLDNSNKLATTNWVRNHCCTTPATTKSTASLDAPCYVIENYVNGTSWYRTYSDKFLEQGGTTGDIAYVTPTTITLMKKFSNVNYQVSASTYRTIMVYRDQFIVCGNKQVGTFQIYSNWAGSDRGETNNRCSWVTNGYTS